MKKKLKETTKNVISHLLMFTHQACFLLLFMQSNDENFQFY